MLHSTEVNHALLIGWKSALLHYKQSKIAARSSMSLKAKVELAGHTPFTKVGYPGPLATALNNHDPAALAVRAGAPCSAPQHQ